MEKRDADSLLAPIIGQRVTEVVAGDEVITFRTDGGWRIAIYNASSLETASAAPLTEENARTLRGTRIVDIKTEPQFVAITFDHPARLVIDLRDEAYSGPEAMLITGPGEVILAWN